MQLNSIYTTEYYLNTMISLIFKNFLKIMIQLILQGLCRIYQMLQESVSRPRILIVHVALLFRLNISRLEMDPRGGFHPLDQHPSLAKWNAHFTEISHIKKLFKNNSAIKDAISWKHSVGNCILKFSGSGQLSFLKLLF